VTPCGAFRVQALDRTARQDMHRSLRLAAETREKQGVNERNSAPMTLVSQEKYLLLVGVHFPHGPAPHFHGQLAKLVVVNRGIVGLWGILELAF
jgi:hypothetical protein